ncbi:MAG: tetratricopeptide repeat protein [Minicystis sp.]
MDRAPNQPAPRPGSAPAPAEDPRRRTRRPNVNASGPALVGREDVIAAVFHTLAHARGLGIVLHGQRRIGKTSILQHLAVAIPDRTAHEPIYVDLHDKAAIPLPAVITELAGTIATVLALPAPVPGTDVEAWFCDEWLPSALAGLPAGTSLVLLLDELDVIEGPQESQAAVALYPYLRRLLKKNGPRLRLVLAIGRSTDDLENIALALFDGLAVRRVSLLAREDAAALSRVAGGGTRPWSDEAIDAAWVLTHGHPLLLQALCANVRAQGQGDRPITGAEVHAAVEPTLSRNRSAFEWIWKGLPPAARAVAAALAPAADGMTEEALFGVLQENGAREILRPLREAPRILVEQDLVELIAPGRYRFRVELLRRLIARYKPPAYAQQDLDLLDPAAEALCRAGESAFRKGDLSTAKARLKEALEKNPNHARALDLLADILIQRKDWAAARPVIERLHESKPLVARPRLLKVLLAQAEAATSVEAQRELYERVKRLDAANPIAGAAMDRIGTGKTERPPPAKTAPPPRDHEAERAPEEAATIPLPQKNSAESALLEKALGAEKKAADAEKKLLDAEKRVRDADQRARASEGRAAALAAERDQVLAEVKASKAEILRLSAVSAEAATLAKQLDAEKKARAASESKAAALAAERDRLFAHYRAEHQPAVMVGADPAVLEKALDAEKKARAAAEARLAALTAERDKLLDEARTDRAQHVRLGHELQTMALERDQLSADLESAQAELGSVRASLSAVPLELQRSSSGPLSDSRGAVVTDKARPKRRQSLLGPAILLVAGVLAIGAGYALQPKRIELSAGAITMSDRSEAQQVSAARILRLGVRRPAASLTWSSADPKVATVDAEGTIRPTGTGRTQIEARDGKVSASVEVRVSLPARIVVDPAEITLSPDHEEAPLKVSILDGAGAPWTKSAAVAWSTSDAAVATIADGKVHRAGPGNAVIEAKLGDLSGRVGVISLDRRAALAKGCEAGRIEACVDLGRLIEKGEEGVAADAAAAVALYEKACDGGLMKGCAEAGAWYEQGKGGTPDLGKALAAYQKACDAKDALGCTRLGGMYESGWGVIRDSTRALSLYREACDAGELDGCWHLGTLYEIGTGTARDAPTAVELYKKACDGGRVQACASLGNMYWNGSGTVPKDVPAGLALFEKACDAKHEPACTTLALKYKTGDGIESSREKSTVFFGKACAAGSKSACLIAPKPAAQ